jgi:DNA-directed RNA polymerase beta subunit
MQRQSVPLILPQKPIVGTGLENQIAAIDSCMT